MVIGGALLPSAQVGTVLLVTFLKQIPAQQCFMLISAILYSQRTATGSQHYYLTLSQTQSSEE